MANRMLERLRKKDKKGLFTRTQTSISYPTRFAPFDYRNGYMVQVRDLQEKLVTQYPSVGIVGGSFNTFVGKAGSAKTTFVIQTAANIVRPFENAFVQHYDLEQATTYTRIKNVTGFTQEELDNKYNLKQERSYIEDIFDSIMEIANEKNDNRADYMYDTGLKDEFNQPIKVFVPTVIILDSIPSATARPSKDENDIEMEGQMYTSRVARALAQFYKRLTPVIKEFNIIVFAINHINAKLEINPMVKTQAQVNYLKTDESLPGGNAPIYYAHNLVKFVTSGKRTEDKHGFDGFDVRAEFIKSRTNKAGQSCQLVYNQEIGFDPIMTQYQFAEDNELVGGKNPYRYFNGFEDIKFDNRKFRKEFLENPALRRALYDVTVPKMEMMLSKVDPSETAEAMNDEEFLRALNRLIESQEGEIFEVTE